MPMAVLITGGSGQLGRDCAATLSAVGRVIVLARRDLDISDDIRVREVLGTLRPAVIVNCAAFTAVDACESRPDDAWRVNALGPAVLARMAGTLGSLLVHFSTDYVFDGARPAPQAYTEADAPGPCSVYGRSKLAGEEAIRGVGDSHLIIRTAWLYGVHGRNFPKTILGRVLREPERPLRVVNDQLGSPTWSRSLAQQTRDLIAHGARGTIHATADGHCSWFDLATAFLAAMGVPHHLEPCRTGDYPTAATRPANSILENRRLKDLGIHRMAGWREDVDAFVAKHRQALMEECAPAGPH
jgi:dTDP-4-dehydrorhamnose reductase